MDSTHLTAEQADDLAGRVAPMLGYVTRLADRLQKRGWPGCDPLLVDARAAQDTLHRLHLSLREIGRLRRAAIQERRPWDPDGSARDGQ